MGTVGHDRNIRGAEEGRESSGSLETSHNPLGPLVRFEICGLLPQTLPDHFLQDFSDNSFGHKSLCLLAPRAGFEPATNRLTAGEIVHPRIWR